MKKKLTALILTLVMLCGCLTGCGGKKDNVQDQAGDGEIPTITVGLKKNANVTDYETNEFTVWLEEQLGINIEFVYFSSNGSEALQKLSLMMAGGEKLPDILYSFGLGKAAMKEYGDDGYLVDLAPYFGTQSPHFDEAVSKISLEEDKAEILRQGTDPETGEMWGFPTYQRSAGTDNATNHICINTKWLEAVGEEMPTTPEELYTVLKKFATMDPNGNGQKDEMPMVGSVKTTRSDTLEWVINAYIYCNDSYFFDVENGKLSVPYTQDEYREALIFLNKLYKEELISPQVFTIASNNEMKEIWTPSSGTAVTGITAGHVQTTYNADSEIVFEYAYLPYLDAGTGKGGYRQQQSSTFAYATYITTDCENPDVAFELLDFLCSDEAFLRMRYGTPGRDWEYAKEGMLDMFGEPAVINVIDSSAFSAQNNTNWHTLASTIADYSTHMMYAPTEGEESYNARMSVWRNQWISDMFADEQKEELVFGIVYPGSVQEEVSELSTNLNSYISESRALFVTGTLDPSNDQHWDEYLKTLDSLGINRYLELAQENYGK